MKGIFATLVTALFALSTIAVPVSAGGGANNTAAFAIIKQHGKQPAHNIVVLKPKAATPSGSTSQVSKSRAANGRQAPRSATSRPTSSNVRSDRQRSASRSPVKRRGAGASSATMRPIAGRRGNAAGRASRANSAPARPTQVAITGSHANPATRGPMRQSGDFGSGFRAAVQPAAVKQTTQTAQSITRRGKGFRVRFKEHK